MSTSRPSGAALLERAYEDLDLLGSDLIEAVQRLLRDVSAATRPAFVTKSLCRARDSSRGRDVAPSIVEAWMF
jgi:hypothetical protein